jgi:hypothetical protein
LPSLLFSLGRRLTQSASLVFPIADHSDVDALEIYLEYNEGVTSNRVETRVKGAKASPKLCAFYVAKYPVSWISIFRARRCLSKVWSGSRNDTF